MCSLGANHYGIRFNSFKVRDYDANKTLFEVQAPPFSEEDMMIPDDLTPEEEAAIRSIKYQFPETMLSLQRIGTTCVNSRFGPYQQARGPGGSSAPHVPMLRARRLLPTAQARVLRRPQAAKQLPDDRATLLP
jgi:hypothetical protein